VKARILALCAAATVVASLSISSHPADAAGKPEPIASVALAKSWDAAVAEAKELGVPLVVHSHGFYCPPCWGMHSAVMCNKKYMEFAAENTVEVLCINRVQEGIDKKDKKAETYEAKVDGKVVNYMVEFPGLTVEEVLALDTSKGASFNDTGKTPYTCVVDPYTETKITGWGGGQGAGTIMDAVTEAKKKFAKEHGKGVSRKDLKLVTDAESEAGAKVTKGDYAAAIDRISKLDAKTDKWSDSLKERVKAAKTKVVDAATAALSAIEEKKATDPAAAKKDLATLSGHLKGTGLESKAAELLASL
jgi:hypothetical protein